MPLTSVFRPLPAVASVTDLVDLMMKMTAKNISNRLNPEGVAQHAFMTVRLVMPVGVGYVAA